jgi:hypothetical protein
MRYFKRKWGEDRGDQFASWGSAIYFFETGPDLVPTRQLEVYANGNRLQYDQQHKHDKYGMLADQALGTEADFAPHAISSAEFEQAWASGPALNA